MKFKWRKWNRIIHRDFGYLFFGMTIIYALSGIAINHINDWDPNYIIKTKEIIIDVPEEINKEEILNILENYGEKNNYKKHYFPKENRLKVFLKNGTLSLDLNNGQGIIETIKKRPIFKPINYLHYNPIKWWTWFSDIFSGALILIAISGLFILKGKKGITKRGAWLTVLGILIPIIYLLIFYY